MSDNETLKLADFGVAKQIAKATLRKDGQSTSLAGTPLFMAPVSGKQALQFSLKNSKEFLKLPGAYGGQPSIGEGRVIWISLTASSKSLFVFFCFRLASSLTKPVLSVFHLITDWSTRSQADVWSIGCVLLEIVIEPPLSRREGLLGAKVLSNSSAVQELINSIRPMYSVRMKVCFILLVTYTT
mmetsp:Transcript_40113/g.103871  ORF Transcript_40113/g.103871 Transcript_40113/m.103871 type:complete len:184 (+) Transcript_40113:1609-2160(+)